MDTKKSTASIFGRSRSAGCPSPVAEERCSAPGGCFVIHSRSQPPSQRYQGPALQSKPTQFGSSTLCTYPETRVMKTLLSDHSGLGMLHANVWTSLHVVTRITVRPTYRRHHSVVFVGHLREYRGACRILGWILTGPIRLLQSLIEISAQRMLTQGWWSDP